LEKIAPAGLGLLFMAELNVFGDGFNFLIYSEV
jgi:hypothetical protein